MTSQQPSNSYDSHPETSSFRAVSPAPQPPLQAPKSPVAIVLIAVLATLCVVAALVLVGLKTGVIGSNDKTPATAASAPESKKNDAPEQAAARPQYPTLPAGACLLMTQQKLENPQVTSTMFGSDRQLPVPNLLVRFVMLMPRTMWQLNSSTQRCLSILRSLVWTTACNVLIMANLSHAPAATTPWCISANRTTQNTRK